jgi:hypothetical protein
MDMKSSERWSTNEAASTASRHHHQRVLGAEYLFEFQQLSLSLLASELLALFPADETWRRSPTTTGSSFRPH